jgi:hypothetical protein
MQQLSLNEEQNDAEPHLSILEQRGKQRLLNDAYRDDTSIMCQYCSALLSKKRLAAHLEFWCDAL